MPTNMMKVGSVALVESGSVVCKVERLDQLSATNPRTRYLPHEGHSQYRWARPPLCVPGVHMLFDGTQIF